MPTQRSGLSCRTIALATHCPKKGQEPWNNDVKESAHCLWLKQHLSPVTVYGCQLMQLLMYLI